MASQLTPPSRDSYRTVALEERFPFAEPLQRAEVNLNLVPGGGQPQIQERLGVVLKNASSTETLTIVSESLTYETTAYTSFEKFLEAVTEACDALDAAKVQPAVQRVGLPLHRRAAVAPAGHRRPAVEHVDQ